MADNCLDQSDHDRCNGAVADIVKVMADTFLRMADTRNQVRSIGIVMVDSV